MHAMMEWDLIALCCWRQVAERSLLLFMNNECVMGLLSQFRVDLVPILVPALEENANRHWNPSVHTLTISVRKFIQEMDKDLYERVRTSHLVHAYRRHERDILYG